MVIGRKSIFVAIMLMTIRDCCHCYLYSSDFCVTSTGSDSGCTCIYLEINLKWSCKLCCRYEACVCSGNKVETIASGLLGQLVLHSPEIKDLSSRGSNANFKLQPPESLESCQWFTKSTLTRLIYDIVKLFIACHFAFLF